MCSVTLHNMSVSAWSGFLGGLFGGLTNNIDYRSVSTTISEGCPYNINRRRIVQLIYSEGCPIDYRSMSTIYIGGLSI